MTVAELLDSQEKWTKGSSARSRKRLPINPHSSLAVQWCLYGAVQRCYGPSVEESSRAMVAIEHQIDSLIRIGAITFNDDPKTTFADIRRVVLAAGV